MSDKENYFPPNTDISVINDTIYTDYGFLCHSEDTDDVFNDTTNPMYSEETSYLEPPF